MNATPRTERIWIDTRTFRHDWLCDPYELMAIEEFYLLVEAVCAQYEAMHGTKLVMRLLPEGCNMSCWPTGYDDNLLHNAIAQAVEHGFGNTSYLPSNVAVAEQLWGSEGFFVETL